jgi:flagellar basal body-associated protein FliL
VDKLLYLLPVLGCAAMMGLMMWMMRGSHANAAQPDPTTAAELARLRAEVAELRGRHGEPVDGADRGTRS